MNRRQVAEQIVENYPYSDEDAAVAHIEAALLQRDTRAAKIAETCTVSVNGLSRRAHGFEISLAILDEESPNT